MSSHGFEFSVNKPTHRQGGWLEVVVSRTSLGIDYIETDNSDHKLLIWSCNLVKLPLIYKQLKTRCWNFLDTKFFMSEIAESQISSSSADVGLETAIELYNTTLTAILDNLITFRTLRTRQRPSYPWFDKECRDSKCLKKKLERRYLRSQCQKELPPSVLQKSLFKRLCRQKRNSSGTQSLVTQKTYLLLLRVT